MQIATRLVLLYYDNYWYITNFKLEVKITTGPVLHRGLNSEGHFYPVGNKNGDGWYRVCV